MVRLYKINGNIRNCYANEFLKLNSILGIQNCTQKKIENPPLYKQLLNRVNLNREML